jgi:chemotaxis protein MotB
MFKKTYFTLCVSVLLSFTLSGCMVLKSTYLDKVNEAEKLSQDITSLQQRNQILTSENIKLQNEINDLDLEIEKNILDRNQIKKDRDNLETLLKSKSDTLSRNIAELRGKNADLEARNSALKENITKLEKDVASFEKTKEEIQTVSKTYDNLLEEMKGEIAKGQITISELKGKLTVNVLEEILFDSGKAEIKKNGLVVLKKVIDVLKNVKDKIIRVEGHTDNVKIGSSLLGKYPTNWELSAARAINVTKYLQNQGIDPAILSSTAYGEYHPVADNSTSEGRAKNRRIAIVLTNKD